VSLSFIDFGRLRDTENIEEIVIRHGRDIDRMLFPACKARRDEGSLIGAVLYLCMGPEYGVHVSSWMGMAFPSIALDKGELGGCFVQCCVSSAAQGILPAT